MFLLSLAFEACTDPCKDSVSPDLGNEYFTVTYQDASGANYLDRYNLAGVIVFVDTTGGANANPQYERINPGYADGKFGPFTFTERFWDAAKGDVNLPLLLGRNFAYDYYIRKDSFGVDTFRVEFLLEANNCTNFWRSIRYYRNGEPLPQYDNKKQVDMVFVE
ncbi:MAG: hypothetical protein D6722_00260 [Bacteroidetes bacterium]|nr:MAG: hypothetical protein D6722_00260 [Bacteroidota bacterium]